MVGTTETQFKFKQLCQGLAWGLNVLLPMIVMFSDIMKKAIN